MKLGLFGGTFDPIHWGHLRSAEEVREAFALDRVLFIPASQPPHKKTRPSSSARERLRMVRLAVAKNRRFAVSAVEISRPGISYSIDTIRHFAGRQTPRHSLFFILGLDAFQEIGSWKEYEKLFPLCDFIVTSRPGSTDAARPRRMPVAARKLFCYDPKKKRYRHRSGTYLSFIKLTDIAISASEIRRRVRNGKSIRYLVPSKVENYIQKRGLYRGRRGGQ